MTDKIQVMPQIADQLEQVRQDGRFNMLDRTGVQWVATELGLYELVVWSEDLPRRDYGRVIMQGVEVIDEDGGPRERASRPHGVEYTGGGTHGHAPPERRTQFACAPER